MPTPASFRSWLALAPVALATLLSAAPQSTSVDETVRKDRVVITRDGNVFNVEARGNLGPNRRFTGKTLDEIEPDNNPVDLLRRAIELWPAEPKAAHALRAAAGLRAAFDMERVSDPTARAASPYLFGYNPGAKRITLWAGLSPDIGQAESKALLAWARKAGPPTYRPTWMIQHGMAAMGGDKVTPDGLKPDFDAAATWKKICDTLEQQASDDAVWKARQAQKTPEHIQSMLDYMEQAVGKNLDERCPSTAEDAKRRMHDIIAGFDPKGADPAMQFVKIHDALDALFDEALDKHHGRK